jgi:glycerophosphoryl diester phosphodiesterase
MKRSVEAGVYGIEIDVHKCKSGELVVLHGGIHGGDVSHHTEGTGLVKDMTWDELKVLRLGKEPGELRGQRIPTLGEIFEAINGRCVLNIEVKNAPWQYENFADDLIAEIAKYKADRRVVLSSFDHGILRELHRKAPHLKLGLLIDGLIVDIGSYARKIGFQCWHPYLGELRADYMKEAHDAGLEVNVWTANSEAEWDLSLELGVDGICTDDPVGLMKYLDKRFPRKTSRTKHSANVGSNGSSGRPAARIRSRNS